MGRVTTEFTMSLDGFIADANDGIGEIFGWYGSGDTEFVAPHSDLKFMISAASKAWLDEEWSQLGALVTGRRDFDVSKAWGGKALLGVPTFIVTHNPPAEWVYDGSPFQFVTEGVEHAVALGKQAAGDKVLGIGGTQIVQQALNLGLIDEIHLHIVPVVLGAGIRLFDRLTVTPLHLEQRKVVTGHGVTHIKYAVTR
ncbi:MAG: dihydrofolate reductase family protein [Chloroflexi bacterium]|nr:dihydrofolate reductase family protein [Chloroflexota bacterium]